jgi:hypothetical protein
VKQGTAWTFAGSETATLGPLAGWLFHERYSARAGKHPASAWSVLGML